MRKDSEKFLKKLLEYRLKTNSNEFVIDYDYFDEIDDINIEILNILKDLEDFNCIGRESAVIDNTGKILIILTLDGITYFDKIASIEKAPDITVINASDSQVSIAFGGGNISAVQNNNQIIEDKLIELLGMLLRIVMRYWACDDELEDIVKFAQKNKLSVFESRNFSFTIEGFVNDISEKFLKEYNEEIGNSKRKREIIDQILKDVEKLNLNESKVVYEFTEPDKLRNAIMELSKDERDSWDENENKFYTSCVRYISKSCVDFILRWPKFSSETLKIIISRQEEYKENLAIILDEIHSMQKSVKSVEITYQEYESMYREGIVQRCSKVELMGSGISDRQVKKYDLSSAYVELECYDNGYNSEIELSEVFDQHNIVWIKGEAGSGKTTFLQWIAICSAKNDYKRVNKIQNTVPILVELRSTEFPLNLQAIVNKFSDSIGYECPNNWLNNVLRKKRAIILIDGLDEIEQNKRENTFEFIEDIKEKYEDIKIIITARNSVNNDLRCINATYEIKPMNMENIKKFVLYWHRSVLYNDAVVEDEKIVQLQTNLVSQIACNAALKNLARNPLLCAMLCAINFVNNQQLPENKMEIYKKCCEMLIEARDMQKKVEINNSEKLPKIDYSRKVRILEELAYWMLRNNKSSEYKTNVEDFLAKQFVNSNILTGENSNFKINHFVNYLIERSGIIREAEIGMIDFIHKTFLEYLAVKAICRSCDWNRIVQEACNVNWKETIIMCFSEMGETQVNQVLRDLVEKGKKEKNDKYILMAALGVSNATFSDKKVNKEIDRLIQSMIPPRSNMEDIAKAGTYLIPFLYNKRKYNDKDRKCCLELLELIDSEKAIPAIMSYLEGNANFVIQKAALELLSMFNGSILDEYNVKEYLCNLLVNSIVKNEVKTSIYMINILNRLNLNAYFNKRISAIEKLHIVFGDNQIGLYQGCYDFCKYFKRTKSLYIYGFISNISFLNYFENIHEIYMKDINMYSENIKQQIEEYLIKNKMKKFNLSNGLFVSKN